MTLAAMRPFRAHGVRFAVDHFGTNYSSPYRLRRLPVDIVETEANPGGQHSLAIASSSDAPS